MYQSINQSPRQEKPDAIFVKEERSKMQRLQSEHSQVDCMDCYH